MKIIISHDVDHITVWEHRRDLIIPKFVVRSFIEFALGFIASSELNGRLKNLAKGKWQNLEELMRFDKENRVPSTFFVAVSNGRGLSYSISRAEYWIKRILSQGFDVGVHGICYENYDNIKEEYGIFRHLSGLDEFGIRMHYLMNSDSTLEFLNKCGYLFDSTTYELSNPYRACNLWEFPLHIMDGNILCKGSRWQDQNLDQAQSTTKRIMEDAFNRGIKYFSILFHDIYFCDSFKTWKEWYMWLIRYLKDNHIEFILYKDAIKDLDVQ
ncbi:MAG: hypothetical protein K8R73_06450 [Clostridiales bacterium]|nr:hypothetical protein [Clostridiales bacterium]